MVARLSTALAGLAALLLAACNDAGAGVPQVSAGDGWTRELAPGQKAAAVYMTITNAGSGEDRLVDVATPIAQSTLHSSSSADGIARMRRMADGIAVAAGSKVELKPGGTHIMLSGLKRPLRAGETIELSLEFARSGRQSIAVKVMPAGTDGGHQHGSSS